MSKGEEGMANRFVLNETSYHGAGAIKEIAAEAKTQLNLDIDKKKIIMAEPIKTMGAHTVNIKLHPEVTATLKVNVEAL